MPKVSVGFDAHDVNFPIRKLVKQVNRVEGVECRFSAFSNEIILSSKEYDSYDLESIYNKYVSELEEEVSDNKEPPSLIAGIASVIFNIDDMGDEHPDYIVEACKDISRISGFSAKYPGNNKVIVEVDCINKMHDITDEVSKYFRVY